MSAPLGLDNPAGGLAINQLLKLKAMGRHHPRAVNSPNSIPPERVFSILNDTFDDDMDSSLADYVELSLQLQFNSRSRK